MSGKVILVLVAAIVICLPLLSGCIGMVSDRYRIEWGALTGGGGGPAASAQYKVNVTVGQSAIGNMANSTGKLRAHLGYWPGALKVFLASLPIVLRSYH